LFFGFIFLVEYGTLGRRTTIIPCYDLWAGSGSEYRLRLVFGQ
jgi:hypothetical protein